MRINKYLVFGETEKDLQKRQQIEYLKNNSVCSWQRFNRTARIQRLADSERDLQGVFYFMNNWLKQEIAKQFARVVSSGWIPHFIEAVEKNTKGFFDEADLMGICSRETNFNPKWLTQAGDNGNGFGLGQADARSFPDWIKTGKWRDAREGILMCAVVLMQKWTQVEKGQRKNLSVYSTRAGRYYSFTGREIYGFNAQKVTIADYNAGLWGYYAYSNGKPIDSYTTGKDYSTDVLERAKEFRVHFNNWKKRNKVYSNTPRQEDFTDLKESEIILDIPKSPPNFRGDSREDLGDATSTDNTVITTTEKEITENLPDGTTAKTTVESESIAGDPPEAPAKESFSVEDLKPFVVRKFKKLWSYFGYFNGSQAAAFVSASVAKPEYTPYFLTAGGLLLLFSLFIVVVGSLVLGVILYRNRKELQIYFSDWIKNQSDPNQFNYELKIEKK